MVNATYSVYMRHGRRAQMDRWACQRAEIQAHATQAVESVANVVKETTILQKSSLLELPDELLLQIAGYLRPTQRLSSADGFPDIPPRELSPGLFEPKAERIGLGLWGFLSLTLTCKRLAPVAGEVLYCDVSLPQLPSESSPHCSRLISFLRTIIKHPEMASRVSHLAVWVQKGRVLRAPNGGLCKCATCFQGLCDIVDQRLPMRGYVKSRFGKDFQCPTEAMVATVILAALPRLQSVELYFKAPKPVNTLVSRTMIEQQLASKSSRDMARLYLGLAASRVEKLKLSSDITFTCQRPLADIKALALEWTGRGTFPLSDVEHYPNVHTFRVDVPDHPMYQRQLGESLDYLLKPLPKLRTLELTSPEGGSIPPCVKKLVIRIGDAGQFTTINWVRDHLQGLQPLSKLQCIDIIWPDGMTMHGIWACYEDLAAKNGVQVLVWSGGEICRSFGHHVSRATIVSK
ncbi:hypothetical protein HBH95_017140 [Parastagonospora nodorum]|nr:hypothetical protein HBH95_017140 [Parastagonospora nodorum]